MFSVSGPVLTFDSLPVPSGGTTDRGLDPDVFLLKRAIFPHTRKVSPSLGVFVRVHHTTPW